jgi:hypothetical protein
MAFKLLDFFSLSVTTTHSDSEREVAGGVFVSTVALLSDLRHWTVFDPDGILGSNWPLFAFIGDLNLSVSEIQ